MCPCAMKVCALALFVCAVSSAPVDKRQAETIPSQDDGGQTPFLQQGEEVLGVPEERPTSDGSDQTGKRQTTSDEGSPSTSEGQGSPSTSEGQGSPQERAHELPPLSYISIPNKRQISQIDEPSENPETADQGDAEVNRAEFADGQSQLNADTTAPEGQEQTAGLSKRHTIDVGEDEGAKIIDLESQSFAKQVQDAPAPEEPQQPNTENSQSESQDGLSPVKRQVTEEDGTETQGFNVAPQEEQRVVEDPSDFGAQAEPASPQEHQTVDQGQQYLSEVPRSKRQFDDSFSEAAAGSSAGDASSSASAGSENDGFGGNPPNGGSRSEAESETFSVGAGQSEASFSESRAESQSR